MRIGAEYPTTDPGDVGSSANGQQNYVASSANTPQANAPNPTPAITPITETQQSSGAKVSTSEELSLSFRRDSDGSPYYVLTDPKSGQIVREVPPEEMRKLGVGIEDYLKAQAARANASRTDLRA